MANIRPFHVAFPVQDLEKTRAFFVDVLGCTIGREADTWIDFNLFGHQISAHLTPTQSSRNTNPVDGKKVPVSHWGVILDWDEWEKLAERVKQNEVQFIIEPYIRFKGQVGEQGTMFFLEPGGGNALEFKTFKDDSNIFKTE